MDDGKTILQVLKEKGYSSANVTALKKLPEGILVNGSWERVTFRLHETDCLSLRITELKSSEKIVPVPLPLRIIYEDEDILVVNKPADMPVHPSLNNYTNTLANAVMYYYSEQKIPFVFRCINRLDRDTTGLVLLAKHAVSASLLSAQMLQREIKREYLALVSGTPSPLEGTIDAPIARKGTSVIEREVNFETGERAVTHYRTLGLYEPNYALLSLHLDTGRTHQIRVHMGYLGCPLIGDSLYQTDLTQIQRQALHSYRLSFHHPITGIPLTFEAEPPADMQQLLRFPVQGGEE